MKIRKEKLIKKCQGNIRNLLILENKAQSGVRDVTAYYGISGFTWLQTTVTDVGSI